jgi:hypothetical protein
MSPDIDIGRVVRSRRRYNYSALPDIARLYAPAWRVACTAQGPDALRAPPVLPMVNTLATKPQLLACQADVVAAVTRACPASHNLAQRPILCQTTIKLQV